jgi:hypothetical protein
MSVNNIFGTIFIRENTLLPAELSIKTEGVFPGWRTVRNLDGYELGREIQKANWNFFYLAGAVKLKVQEFNCLEITQVIAKGFLGIPFLCVTANSRHIQESPYLVPIEGLASGAVLRTKWNSSERLRGGEVLVKQDAALV